jgi:hypothetical protein
VLLFVAIGLMVTAAFLMLGREIGHILAAAGWSSVDIMVWAAMKG